jgi:hypothetical protein
MDSPAFYVLVGAVGILLLRLVIFFLLAGGNLQRLGLAMNTFWRALRDPTFAEKVQPLLAPPEAKPTKPVRPSGVPLRLLGLLQREGRLLDFLMEDIQGYGDDQVGTAVREIHRKCQAALKEHLTLEPVLAQNEGEQVQVPAGFDPSAIRLTGNVTGQPPFRGTLQHRGWRVREYQLSPPPEGQDEFVLMPAEVEMP